MKLFLAVLSLAAVAYAQLDMLTKHEVMVIVGANPGITVDQCADICDGLFDLVDVIDEQISDDMCRSECDCQINQNCATSSTDGGSGSASTTMMPGTTSDDSGATTTMGGSATNAPPATTQAPHHTHPTHPPHPTHPTHPPHGHHG